jgi:hypothetical protein
VASTSEGREHIASGIDVREGRKHVARGEGRKHVVSGIDVREGRQ